MRFLAAIVIGAVAGSALYPGDIAGVEKGDPLPSWNDGAAKKRLVEFVRRVTEKGGEGYVRPAERVAVFDNDGTLWCEQPFYFQGAFAFDRVKKLAPERPEWREKEPFKSIIDGDKARVARFGEKELASVLAATHAGMTTDEFHEAAKGWLDTAKHPRFGRLYKECVYRPQLELLAHLRANEFKTYIVSGGGVDFIRAYAEGAYGIPPEQVIGSSGKTKFEMKGGKPVLRKLPAIGSVDDGPGKPVNIDLHIGRLPILAFGNSDGDLEMLQYVAGKGGEALILHHDDEKREYAYGRDSHIGKLDKALDEAEKQGWTVVSMKKDFKKVFPFDK